MAVSKPLTTRQRAFAKALHDGYGSIHAARLHLKWKCEPNSAQYQAAKDLARSARVLAEIERIRTADMTVAQATSIVTQTNKLDLINLRQFAYDRLCIMRDDSDVPAKSRFMAVQALEKLNDPSKDINLIIRWIDIMWRFYTGHCPACHADFPLWKIKNERLNRYREDHNIPADLPTEKEPERRIALIKRAEKLRHPHPGQVAALIAPERHIVGTGPARAGKSLTLAMFCLMYLLIPGVEVWILARVYDDAEPEFNYLKDFLKTLLGPAMKHMIDLSFDHKTGESSIVTRWGSVIKIKSGKSQGSITGHELEFAGVAEPAWVDAKLYEELRARMSSRLGRIVALGTPKGFGGFIHRMVKQAARGADGKISNPEDRLISRGCRWSRSLLLFNFNATENPAYVKSEIETARDELTKEEFASEFEGLMMAAEGARFPYITQKALVNVPNETYDRCVYVLGVDQGPKNMGACLLGYDGHNVYTAWEYFDNSDMTAKANLIYLNYKVGPVIFNKGGNADNWQLTIFDADPPVQGLLEEMKNENKAWKTEEAYRPKNLKDFTNWREETMEWINDMAQKGRFFFDARECDILHDQVREALIKPADTNRDGTSTNSKGWIVRDVWRGDHVMDAWLLACFTIMMGELSITSAGIQRGDAFEEQRRYREYMRITDEKKQLSGNGHNNEVWKTIYGQDMPKSNNLDIAGHGSGYYDDES